MLVAKHKVLAHGAEHKAIVAARLTRIGPTLLTDAMVVLEVNGGMNAL